MTRKLLAGILFAITCSAAGAAVEIPATTMFSFGGFGTFGVVHSSEHNADFTSTGFKPNGAGYSHNWSSDVDSLIGGQVIATISPRLSAVLQVIAEQNYDNSYLPHVEWANVRYQFTPDFSVRVGRTALPSFMVADSRNVGYANPWVRPPVDVYLLSPVTSNDGIEASYRLQVGAASNRFQITIGRTDAKLPTPPGRMASASARGRGQVTVVDSIEHGFTTVRLAYNRASLTIPGFHSLFDAFRQFGPQGAAIADRYDVNQRLITSFALGATYDPGNWFVTGEWVRATTHSILGDHTAWYATGGYRVGQLTPYATYSQTRLRSNATDHGLTLSNLPPLLAVPAVGLDAFLDSFLRQDSGQRTIAVGGRWDFRKNVAFKLQYDHTSLDAGSSGTLNNFQPDFRSGRGFNLVSATIDFVF